jgi:hypothetical protein
MAEGRAIDGNLSLRGEQSGNGVTIPLRHSLPVAPKVKSAPPACYHTLAMRQARKRSAIVSAAQTTPAGV